jgi:hypothetical protein
LKIYKNKFEGTSYMYVKIYDEDKNIIQTTTQLFF